jgi:acetyl-CoA carboxylase carboxyl transferase subunit alpha
MKVIDGIVKEPVGGAHRAPDKAIKAVGKAIDKALQTLLSLSPQELKVQRRERFYAIGREGLN